MAGGEYVKTAEVDTQRPLAAARGNCHQSLRRFILTERSKQDLNGSEVKESVKTIGRVCKQTLNRTACVCAELDVSDARGRWLLGPCRRLDSATKSSCQLAT